MTVAQLWSVQTAVFQAVRNALAGEGPSGADVPVFDHAPQSPPPVFARLDSHTVGELELKSGAIGRHGISVHVFDRQDGGARRGQAEVKRLLALLDAPLRSLTVGDSRASIESASVSADEDGETWHGLIRLGVWVQ